MSKRKYKDKNFSFGLANATTEKLFPQVIRSEFDKVNDNCPHVPNPNCRLGWLILKKHFGPINTQERDELERLSNNKEAVDKLNRVSNAK